jgi:hypothetical protein
VVPDNLTKLESLPEQNLRAVLLWIKQELAKEPLAR